MLVSAAKFSRHLLLFDLFDFKGAFLITDDTNTWLNINIVLFFLSMRANLASFYLFSIETTRDSVPADARILVKFSPVTAGLVTGESRFRDNDKCFSSLFR